MPVVPEVSGHEWLNPWILEQIALFPVGGGYRFSPSARTPSDPTNPRDPTYDGVKRPLTVDGVTIAAAATDGATYCCGVTLEVFWRAWQAALQGSSAAPGGMSPSQAKRFVELWFCPTMGASGAQEALERTGLGVAVAPEAARPGDFVQYWRSTDLAQPSGHSAVFLGWETDGALRYWSSQPATDGIHVHREMPGPEWTWAFARAFCPEPGGQG